MAKPELRRDVLSNGDAQKSANGTAGEDRSQLTQIYPRHPVFPIGSC